MKKTNLLSLVLLMLFFSCQKDLKDVEKNSANINQLFYNATYSNETNDTRAANLQNKNDINFERYYIETENIENLKNQYFNFISIDDAKKIKWLVLYSSNKFSEYDNVLDNQYNAISVIYLNSTDDIRHSLYKKTSDNQFNLDSSYDTEANSLLFPRTLKQIAIDIDVANKSFLAITNVNLDFEAIPNNTANRNNENREVDDYSFTAENNLFAKTLDEQKLIDGSYSDCNPMNCAGPPEVGCKIDGGPGGGLDCRGDITDICVQERVNKRIEEENNSIAKLDLNKSRNFRDNFLKESTKGQKYIDYYYQINYVLQGLDFSKKIDLIKQYDFAIKLYELIDKIESSNTNEVLINNTDKLYYLNEIDKVGQISNNKEFQNILNNISADIIDYTNKSKAQVLLDFE